MINEFKTHFCFRHLTNSSPVLAVHKLCANFSAINTFLQGSQPIQPNNQPTTHKPPTRIANCLWLNIWVASGVSSFAQHSAAQVVWISVQSAVPRRDLLNFNLYSRRSSGCLMFVNNNNNICSYNFWSSVYTMECVWFFGLVSGRKADGVWAWDK